MHVLTHGRRGERGQALPLIALCMTVILGATAMVIDGGNAMAQQRGTQNAADAAALAGATVIAQKFGGGSFTDFDVATAVDDAFDRNGSEPGTSYYVDYTNGVVGTVGRGGSIPSGAGGVRATGNRTFDTFLAGVLGINEFTANAEATARAGALRSICRADDGCAVMPVTFSIPITTCDGTNQPLRIGDSNWPLVGLDVARADSSGTYESIVPLCTNGPGGVGWLDMKCGATNLAAAINTPCNGPYDLSGGVWLQSEPGDANNVESALNNYSDQVILVPMFDSTCREVPSTGLPADCTDPGNGNGLWYHIPRFATFLLDEAYVQGNNHPECNSGPGQPLVGDSGNGNGSTSCFKGWFVRWIMQGKVGDFDDCSSAGGSSDCLHEPILGVQLVR
jgi:hypothetical protein